MSVYGRLRALAEALPSDSSAVTLTRADIRALLDAEDAPAAPALLRDLSVEEVAERVGRAPSTVRGWLIAGALRGAYKLNTKTWRVPPAALDEFLAEQARPRAPEPEDGAEIDIGAWRRLRSAS